MPLRRPPRRLCVPQPADAEPDALVDPKLGWDIHFPRVINDAGQITAWAYRNGVQYSMRPDLLRPHALSAPDMKAEDD